MIKHCTAIHRLNEVQEKQQIMTAPPTPLKCSMTVRYLIWFFCLIATSFVIVIFAYIVEDGRGRVLSHIIAEKESPFARSLAIMVLALHTAAIVAYSALRGVRELLLLGFLELAAGCMMLGFDYNWNETQHNVFFACFVGLHAIYLTWVYFVIGVVNKGGGIEHFYSKNPIQNANAVLTWCAYQPYLLAIYTFFVVGSTMTIIFTLFGGTDNLICAFEFVAVAGIALADLGLMIVAQLIATESERVYPSTSMQEAQDLYMGLLHNQQASVSGMNTAPLFYHCNGMYKT